MERKQQQQQQQKKKKKKKKKLQLLVLSEIVNLIKQICEFMQWFIRSGKIDKWKCL